ncbi:hypothetical protein [Rhodoblastus sp.]|uniref:hypothetical protein n=1 Tax=Rhodoblastus sp. TaxID=1962975 RepID=UPI0035ADF4B4
MKIGRQHKMMTLLAIRRIASSNAKTFIELIPTLAGRSRDGGGREQALHVIHLHRKGMRHVWLAGQFRR